MKLTRVNGEQVRRNRNRTIEILAALVWALLLAFTVLLSWMLHSAPAQASVLVYLRQCDSEYDTSGLVFVGLYSLTPTGRPSVRLYFDEWCPDTARVELQ